MDKIYGLLGRKLGHSWSVPIHAALGCRDYRLIELEPADLPAFLRREDLGGLNVTIPYKREVMPFCDVIDPMARSIGSVNTLVRRPTESCTRITPTPRLLLYGGAGGYLLCRGQDRCFGKRRRLPHRRLLRPEAGSPGGGRGLPLRSKQL